MAGSQALVVWRKGECKHRPVSSRQVAQLGGGGSLFTNSREQWERTFNICWGGAYLGVRTFLPMLVAADEAHIVNTASVNGFWASIGGHGSLGTDADGVRVELVVTLLVGGVLAAPLAPFFVTRVPPNLLGVIIGGFLCVTNSRALVQASGASKPTSACLHAAVALMCIGAATVVARRKRQEEVTYGNRAAS